MKDPVGILLALLAVGNGVNFFIKPERFLKPNTERRDFKIRRFKIIGMSLFIIGVVLFSLRLTE
jgi:hypothetical protein